MIRKNFFLFFLAINIMLPICFSFITVLSAEDKDEYTATFLNCPEEESKEDNNPFEKENEKEKNFISVGFTLSPFVSLLERNIYLHNHAKPINGSMALPYNPPELF